jgi:predicted GIY-YIG superfamily endonuclease
MNFNNSKIYKIVSKEGNKIYIGSTIQTLSKRFRTHKSFYNLWMNGLYHYVSSFEVLKFKDAEIILIENYNCDNKEQLRNREAFYIKSLDCVNINIAGRTKKKYNQEFKELIAKQKQQYNKKNYEKFKKIKQEKDIDVLCECGKIHKHSNTSRHLRTSYHFIHYNLNLLKELPFNLS